MTIKLELPANDPIVLNEMGLALTRIASALRGDTVTTTVETVMTELPAATIEEITQAEVNAGNITPTIETVIEQPTDNAATVFTDTNVNVDIDNSVIDSDGVPWDTRIHSREKTKNANGTYKVKRKPADYATKDDWILFVDGVKQELLSAMSAVVTPPETVVEPPAIVTPPETVVEPPAIVENTVKTFQDLMLLITKNNKKINKDQVNEIINAAGLPGANPVPLLATRTDLIPQIAQQIMVVING